MSRNHIPSNAAPRQTTKATAQALPNTLNLESGYVFVSTIAFLWIKGACNPWRVVLGVSIFRRNKLPGLQSHEFEQMSDCLAMWVFLLGSNDVPFN